MRDTSVNAPKRSGCDPGRSVAVKHYGRVALDCDPLAARWELLSRVQARADELAAIREGVIESQHGPGTSMRVGYGHPDWDRADDHWRKAHRLESRVFGWIVHERAQLSADDVCELTPVPWILRGGGCWPKRSTYPEDRHGYALGGCIVDEMRSYAAAGERATTGGGKSKRSAVDLAAERLEKADGEWVDEGKLAPTDHQVHVLCALVMRGLWIEAGRGARRSGCFHDRRFRLLGRFDVGQLCACGTVDAVGGPVIERQGRGRWQVEQVVMF